MLTDKFELKAIADELLVSHWSMSLQIKIKTNSEKWKDAHLLELQVLNLWQDSKIVILFYFINYIACFYYTQA